MSRQLQPVVMRRVHVIIIVLLKHLSIFLRSLLIWFSVSLQKKPTILLYASSIRLSTFLYLAGSISIVNLDADTINYCEIGPRSGRNG
jgi:hypothetical protein